MARVCVVGAGVSGLATAVSVQEITPDVTIVSEKFNPDVTSCVAAGFWFPHCLSDTPLESVRRWGSATFRHLMKHWQSSQAADMGLQLLHTHMLYTKSTQPEPGCKDELLHYRDMNQKELSLYPARFVKGISFSSLTCDSRHYLSYLMKEYRARGGKVHQRKIHRLQDLFDEYDIVVNCAGIGAHDLAQDNLVYPVRGQVIRVWAPWIKHAAISEDGYGYIIPAADGSVILGGTHQEGNWNLGVDEQDKQNILNACWQLIPSLKGAKILDDLVGLRPCRSRVRLEEERAHVGKREIQIVHNYGHGGGGITLHWGCAQDAKRLVQAFVTKQQAKL